jgi:hypothetical protein
MTVNFSGTVPLDITIDVDTDPFDNSVSGVKRSVDVLTGAVVTMNTAQCAAIQRTADEVSQSLIDGFFGTIKTEISQQLQALDSAIKAGFGLISEQGKAISNQRNLMEADYNRISSRYLALFSDLDAECYKRIYALDKPAFALSENILKKLILDAGNNRSAGNFITIQEESASRAMLLVSSVYRKVRDVMKTLYGYITQESRLTALINSSLENEKTEAHTPILLPVIYTESDTLEGISGGTEQPVTHSSFIPEGTPDKDKAIISERAAAYCTGASVSWNEVSDNERELLNREFMILGEEDFGGLGGAETEAEKRRVYDTLIGLWQGNKLYTLSLSQN